MITHVNSFDTVLRRQTKLIAYFCITNLNNEGKRDYTSVRHRSLISISYFNNLIKRYLNPLKNLKEYG